MDFSFIWPDINFVDSLTGMMPIHAAASWGNPKCIEVKAFEWLSNHGANMLSRNLFGQTPADMALSNQFPELADQIRRCGIKKIKENAQQTRILMDREDSGEA
ncbi:unnamed protein product [Echinostoma caproni]|uniref:ANK_REP_REGION domain-containing protein n=1 Tax=Echinostoma caproni TaxID=27848 RepID=A0A183AJW1_9TREM|nr:unnamed protein product [Echinostoma caproni]